MKLPKIPNHLWYAAIIPVALLGVAFWQLWPGIEKYRSANEQLTIRYLDSLGLAQRDFYWGDIDNNGVKDFWTGDIVGLFPNAIDPEEPILKADAAPLVATEEEPTPLNGYYFAVLERDNSCTPPQTYQQDTDGSGRMVSNVDRSGFCAYPATYNWRHHLTFILNEDGLIYCTDNGGKRISEWPTQIELTERFWRPVWMDLD